MPLVSPWWQYLGATLAIGVFVLTLAITFITRSSAPADVVVPSAITLAGLFVYARMFNRFGGPWWVASIYGTAGLIIAVLGLLAVPELGPFLFTDAAAITWPVIAGLALLSLTMFFARHAPPRLRAEVADPAVVAAARNQAIRRLVQGIIAGAIALVLVLATLSLPFWNAGFVGFFEFLAGTIPGLTIAGVLPSIIRIIALAVDGPRAIQRLQARRQERAQRIIRLLGAP